MINGARQGLLAIGCIQAQRCHTDHCPTGVATHNAWLTRGLDPSSKAVRLANYVINLRQEITRLSHACGAEHPSLVASDRFEISDGRYGTTSLLELFAASEVEELRRVMALATAA